MPKNLLVRNIFYKTLLSFCITPTIIPVNASDSDDSTKGQIRYASDSDDSTNGQIRYASIDIDSDQDKSLLQDIIMLHQNLNQETSRISRKRSTCARQNTGRHLITQAKRRHTTTTVPSTTKEEEINRLIRAIEMLKNAIIYIQTGHGPQHTKAHRIEVQKNVLKAKQQELDLLLRQQITTTNKALSANSSK